jgi:hypothetical protein
MSYDSLKLKPVEFTTGPGPKDGKNVTLRNGSRAIENGKGHDAHTIKIQSWGRSEN